MVVVGFDVDDDRYDRGDGLAVCFDLKSWKSLNKEKYLSLCCCSPDNWASL